MSCELRIEVNGIVVPDEYMPTDIAVVHPSPVATTLNGLPIYEGWPIAYLRWPEAMTQSAMQYWKGKVGIVTDVMLPDPYGSIGDLVRDSQTYKGHAEYSYGVVISPLQSQGNRLRVGTEAGSIEHMIESGTITIEIRDLGRFPTWPML